MVDYYPEQLSISLLNKQFEGLNLIDEAEEQRLQDVADKKKRGKGAPKKAKSAGLFILSPLPSCGSSTFTAESRRAQRKR